MITATVVLQGRLQATAALSQVKIQSADIDAIDTAIDEINGEVIAGDTFDKLDATEVTKLALELAIENKGVDVPVDAPFSDYPGYVDSIMQGAGTYSADFLGFDWVPVDILYTITVTAIEHGLGETDSLKVDVKNDTGDSVRTHVNVAVDGTVTITANYNFDGSYIIVGGA